MISIGVFNILIAVVILLFIYSIADLDNRIYGNIIAGFLCTLFAGYVAVIANTGIVEDGGVVMQDLSLQIMFIMFTGVMMIYTLYMTVEAWFEYQQGAEEI